MADSLLTVGEVAARLKVSAVTWAVMLALAGCGGGGSASPEETWASSVCASISTWKTDVDTITSDAADALTKPGATVADINTAIEQGVQATETLVSDLQALVPPDTAEGAQAKDDVDAFIAQAQATLDDVKTALHEIPAGASLQKVVLQLAGLGTSLQRAIATGQELVQSLEAIGGDLKQGFASADSCKDLR